MFNIKLHEAFLSSLLLGFRRHAKSAYVFVLIGLCALASVRASAASAQLKQGQCVTARPLHFIIRSDVGDTYTAWARIRSTSPEVKLFLASENTCSVATATGYASWTWVRFETPLSLSQGEQAADLAASSEVEVDKLLFMVDSSCAPEGSNGDNCAEEHISLSISGVEPEVTAGSSLRISAEVHGASEPKVTFKLDDRELTGGGALNGEGIYCAVAPEKDICGVMPPTLLSIGMHTLSAVVVDGDRTVSEASTFYVQLDTPLFSEDKKSNEQASQKQADPLTAADQDSKSEGTPSELSIGQASLQTKEAPTFVLGQGMVLNETLSGTVGLSVPSDMVPKGTETLDYFVDDQKVGTVLASELPFIYDTSQLDNHGHQFRAVVSDGSTQVSAVEVAAIINNNPFNSLKNWVARPHIRLLIIAVCALLSLLVLIILLRSHIRMSRLKAVTGVNTQRVSFVSPTHVGARGYGILAVLTLVTVSMALIAAPATPAYDGNASTIVELEDARINYDHETATDEVTNSTYILLK